MESLRATTFRSTTTISVPTRACIGRKNSKNGVSATCSGQLVTHNLWQSPVCTLLALRLDTLSEHHYSFFLAFSPSSRFFISSWPKIGTTIRRNNGKFNVRDRAIRVDRQTFFRLACSLESQYGLKIKTSIQQGFRPGAGGGVCFALTEKWFKTGLLGDKAQRREFRKGIADTLRTGTLPPGIAERQNEFSSVKKELWSPKMNRRAYYHVRFLR